ncbi:MAG: hypothetical protein AB7H92_05350 [Microbacteriaceae bacterium]
MANKDQRDFLLEEHRATWEHFRHVEDERVKYLTFYFTASLGSAAVVAPLLGASEFDPREQLLAGAGFVAVFQAVTFFVLVTVRRLGIVLVHYGKMLWDSRLRRARLVGVPPHIARLVTVRGKARSRKPAWMNSVQKTAEVTLAGFLLADFALAVALCVVAASGFDRLTFAFCVAVATGSLVAVSLVAQSYVRDWQSPKEDRRNPNDDWPPANADWPEPDY